MKYGNEEKRRICKWQSKWQCENDEMKKKKWQKSANENMKKMKKINIMKMCVSMKIMKREENENEKLMAKPENIAENNEEERNADEAEMKESLSEMAKAKWKLCENQNQMSKRK